MKLQEYGNTIYFVILCFNVFNVLDNVLPEIKRRKSQIWSITLPVVFVTAKTQNNSKLVISNIRYAQFIHWHDCF